ncbi:MAG: NAD(P)/FAD-dependent oxidoreductase [Nitrospirae bacterium]|nr:NAD(P)/FAD-dependent oxidoreductase [Nitrospirota bacterium]
MAGKIIVVLGAGVGGLVTANELRRKLGEEHKIILIDKSKEHVSYSSALWVITGARTIEEIKKPVSRLLQNGIEFFNEEIQKIDPANKTVKTATKEISYDYLVVSLGVSLEPENIPGLTDALKKNACNFYDLNGVLKARDALNNFTKGTIIIMVSALPYKCPVAPNEFSLLLNDYFTKRGIRKDVKIKVCTPEVLPMGGNGPKTGGIVKGLMESAGVEYNSQHILQSVNADRNEIVFDKGTMSYDLLLVIPPHKAPKVVVEAGLAEPDWIPVDKGTLKTKFDNIYTIGDIAKIKLPGEWKQGVPLMLSKGGVFAHFEAKVVAENIANEILGRKERVEYAGRAACFVEAGFGKAGLAQGYFFTAPTPDTVFLQPSKLLHFSKVMFEKYWLSESSLFRGIMDFIMEKWGYGEYKRKVK